jgi:hypothetical protein
MNDLMIDLETVSLKPNATILTIAAVLFNCNTGETGAELHIACSLDQNQNRHIDISTIDWWAEPKQAAAKTELVAFLKQNPHRLDLALEKLTRFIKKHKPKQIWGNSPSFDLAILTDAYQQHDMPVPWPFWIERDTRTMVNVCRQLTGIDPKKQIDFDGTAHSALADAIYQARYVSNAFNLIAKGLTHE